MMLDLPRVYPVMPVYGVNALCVDSKVPRPIYMYVSDSLIVFLAGQSSGDKIMPSLWCSLRYLCTSCLPIILVHHVPQGCLLGVTCICTILHKLAARMSLMVQYCT